jgi:hypothetical protein
LLLLPALVVFLASTPSVAPSVTPVGTVEASNAGRLTPALRAPFAPLSLTEALSRTPLRGLKKVALSEQGLLLAPVLEGLYLGRPRLMPKNDSVVFFEEARKRKLWTGYDPRQVRYDVDVSLRLTRRVSLQLNLASGEAWCMGLSIVVR